MNLSNTAFSLENGNGTVIGIILIIVVIFAVYKIFQKIRQGAAKAATVYGGTGLAGGAGATNYNGITEHVVNFINN